MYLMFDGRIRKVREVLSDRANRFRFRNRPWLIQGPALLDQVIGNVNLIIMKGSIRSMAHTAAALKPGETSSLQLQQGQIGVAVICAILALLRHVVLEHGRGFGVISIEAIQNGINMLWPIRRMVKGDAHDDGELKRVGGIWV